MPKTRDDDPFLDGQECYQAGLTLEENPWFNATASSGSGLQAKEDWIRGYNDAKSRRLKPWPGCYDPAIHGPK